MLGRQIKDFIKSINENNGLIPLGSEFVIDDGNVFDLVDEIPMVFKQLPLSLRDSDVLNVAIEAFFRDGFYRLYGNKNDEVELGKFMDLMDFSLKNQITFKVNNNICDGYTKHLKKIHYKLLKSHADLIYEIGVKLLKINRDFNSKDKCDGDEIKFLLFLLNFSRLSNKAEDFLNEMYGENRIHTKYFFDLSIENKSLLLGIFNEHFSLVWKLISGELRDNTNFIKYALNSNVVFYWDDIDYIKSIPSDLRVDVINNATQDYRVYVIQGMVDLFNSVNSPDELSELLSGGGLSLDLKEWVEEAVFSESILKNVSFDLLCKLNPNKFYFNEECILNIFGGLMGENEYYPIDISASLLKDIFNTICNNSVLMSDKVILGMIECQIKLDDDKINIVFEEGLDAVKKRFLDMLIKLSNKENEFGLKKDVRIDLLANCGYFDGEDGIERFNNNYMRILECDKNFNVSSEFYKIKALNILEDLYLRGGGFDLFKKVNNEKFYNSEFYVGFLARMLKVGRNKNIVVNFDSKTHKKELLLKVLDQGSYYFNIKSLPDYILLDDDLRRACIRKVLGGVKVNYKDNNFIRQDNKAIKLDEINYILDWICGDERLRKATIEDLIDGSIYDSKSPNYGLLIKVIKNINDERECLAFKEFLKGRNALLNSNFDIGLILDAKDDRVEEVLLVVLDTIVNHQEKGSFIFYGLNLINKVFSKNITNVESYFKDSDVNSDVFNIDAVYEASILKPNQISSYLKECYEDNKMKLVIDKYAENCSKNQLERLFLMIPNANCFKDFNKKHVEKICKDAFKFLNPFVSMNVFDELVSGYNINTGNLKYKSDGGEFNYLAVKGLLKFFDGRKNTNQENPLNLFNSILVNFGNDIFKINKNAIMVDIENTQYYKTVLKGRDFDSAEDIIVKLVTNNHFNLPLLVTGLRRCLELDVREDVRLLELVKKTASSGERNKEIIELCSYSGRMLFKRYGIDDFVGFYEVLDAKKEVENITAKLPINSRSIRRI